MSEFHRSSFKSPGPSRAPTPVASRYKHPRFAYQDSLEVPVSRSHSRARPGRTVEIPFTDPINRQANLNKVPPTGPLPKSEKDVIRDGSGEETSENARVWHIYNDEAHRADTLMTDGWSRSIDVLLVFTGLFSAVLTTFIIQSYQLMLPAAADTTNVLLVNLIALQFNSTGPPSIPSGPQSTNIQIHWVNGLWFSALACSLSTALISMLAKQWLQAYLPNVSGSPRHRARQRQARFMNLEAWLVPEIINALPLLLHVALLLFFAGLVVLLWSVDLAISLATWIIVLFAYTFYFASIGVALLNPACPYQHPIADRLRLWLSPDPKSPPPPIFVSNHKKEPFEDPGKYIYDARASVATFEDAIDATALTWLFNKSTDQAVVSAALQAIAGLPRDFSALRILRDAGALPLIEHGFQSCYHKDTTVDLQWHLVDAESAELYCRAWMRLTRGTAEQWPFDIVEPLWMLQDDTHPDAAAIASCAVALSSFDSHMSQWELLAYLARCTAGETQLSETTQCCILDSISECLVRWEMPLAVIEDTAVRAVPVLLRMLHLTEDLPNSKVRSAAALALYIVTCGGAVDLGLYMSEEKRRREYCELMIEALSAIVATPARFGVHDALLDIVGAELARLATPIVAQSERFPQRLRTVARSSLSALYAAGRIAQGNVPDSVLADVLHLLFPPALTQPQQSVFVTTLVETLETSSHPDITNWAVRLLEVLLARCSLAVLQAFVESNGINAVVRAARAGAVDSRRLQIDSLRTMCAFIASTTREYKTTPTSHPTLDIHIEALLQSDFFDTLCSIVASRRWWLFEVSGHWLPAIVELCRIRPDAKVWLNVLKTFKEFAERNVGEDGYSETLSHLEVIKKVSEEDSTPVSAVEV
ncbi:hypothetical protein B0H14DRAFT_1270677 [Mycena olivaceomarginata]|nr:hypothetical protein B0H14DRAFT_1270677 [Mycena olivaceomarginata]